MNTCDEGHRFRGTQRCPICVNRERHSTLAAHCRCRDWTLHPEEHTRALFSVECDRGHRFTLPTSSTTYLSTCPVCAANLSSPFKTEQIISHWLHTHLPDITFTTQVSMPWTDHAYRFDFLFPAYRVIIELDGIQHFNNVLSWSSSSDDVRESDVRKMYAALANGYTVLRLYQPDVWSNRIPWKPWIHAHLHVYEKPMVYVLAADPSRYTSHLTELQLLLNQD